MSIIAAAVLPTTAVLADTPLDACTKEKGEAKVDCILRVVQSSYVYVGREVRLNNVNGPRKGCLAANDPTAPDVRVLPMPCDKDTRQNWKVEDIAR